MEISDILGIYLTLEELKNPPFNIQYAKDKLAEKIYEWSREVTITDIPNTTKTDIEF